MKTMIYFSAGLVAALLGGLWLLQGLGIVQIRPILCFADCVPIQGASAMWAAIGAITLAAGGILIYRSWKRYAASQVRPS